MSHDNSSTGIVAHYEQSSGGVERVHIGRPSHGDSAQHEAQMLARSAGADVREHGAAVSMHDAGAGVPNADGTITSARTQWGSPVSGDRINGDCTISIDGMDVSIKAALAARLVAQNPDGTYRLTGGAATPGKR